MTVPSGTLWLESEIQDQKVCKEIRDKEIVAYSVTISEKTDADTVMKVYKNNSNANKEDITTELESIDQRLSNKKTLIKDIKDPVLLTVSVVKFPCVNKAKFCKKSLQIINDNGENMTNKDDETKTFIETVQNAVKNFTQNNTSDETVEETGADVVETIIDEKMGALKTELQEEIKADHESILNAIKEELRTAPTITEEEAENVDDNIGDDGVVPATATEEAPETDKAEKLKQPIPKFEDEPENKEEEEETAPTTEKQEDEEIEEKIKETKTVGKGDKSYKHEKMVFAEPTAQTSRKSGKLGEETKKMTIKRNEDDIIYDAIKGGISTKGINMEEVDLTGTGLTSTYNNDVFLSLLNNKYAQEVYKASFGEDDSNKAILTTNVFSTFVTKLIQEEPIFLDANYQTGHHGKGYIYDLDNGTYDTEDGHLPENFYFDKDPADDEFDIDVREIRCYTQRRKVTISDRQRLSNIYGDDLVNKVLEISRKKLFRGVYAARVWSDTTLANSVDKQYRRQDGLIKQAGQQLDGATDVNLDKAVDIFRTMFYALPEEARTPSDYCFYVPTNVYLAYYNYISESKRESRYEWVSQEQSLYWNNIPIKVSPALNRADMKTLCYDGDSAVLLTSPTNTNLIVGREAGIEPKRNADTSSDTFYETIDTGVVYSQPDYAVALTIGADDYEGLIGSSEGGNTGGSP